MSMCEIKFANPTRDAKYISGFSIQLLKHAMTKSGVNRLLITSTYRSEEDQARVMLNNLTPGKSMYKAEGRKVEAVGTRYASEKKAIDEGMRSGFDPNRPLPHLTQSREEVESAMALKIHDLERHKGAGCVSHHQMNPKMTNVFDIDPKHVEPSSSLVRLIMALTNSPSVTRVGLPGGMKGFSHKHFKESVHCLHVEIPQPQIGNASINASRIA